MSDYCPDTPAEGRAWCPGCEPGCDPTLEILDTRWCDSHAPLREGGADSLVVAQAYLSGSAEAGGEDNRRICELIHRGITVES